RKRAIRAPTLSLQAEGNMHGSVNASSWTALRSRRPQTRLETSCTRTGRPRGCLLSNRTAGRREKAMAVRPACTSPRVGQRHITYETIEQRRETVGGDRGGKAADQGGSSRQGRGSSEVKVLVPSIARSRTGRISGGGGG